ncbi:MAG: cbb3-type cytochrome c oxidase subunit I, partial [Chloroflexota bacterium]|nr:cbb3-type cytochrome c oxidase subunit I [Chloroflexota bacterium]
VVLVGFSSILGAINFVVTTLKLRAPGLTVWRIPIFVWSIFGSALIVLLATSFLAGDLTLVLLERTFNMAFFDPARGGQPLLYQNLFWFYSHPAVYIMAVPAFGVLLEVLVVFCRKPLFAYRLVVVSFLSIVFLGAMVWAHHLFVAGMPNNLRAPFMIATELISVPTGGVFLAALGTLWRARIRLEVPMLFVLGSLVTFLVGGITGIYLADVPTDMYLSGTYFLPAHFHYTMVGATIFGLMAGTYFWFPKISGRMMFNALGRLHFWLFFVGFQLTFMPMFWLGMNGMPRRYATYDPALHTGNVMATLGSYVLGLGALAFVVNLVATAFAGKRAPANPWRSRTLEWQTLSPPPPHNFERTPVVKAGPYDYGDPEAGEVALFPVPIAMPREVVA